jgi:broad specificity phosphatase PhoE
VTRPTTIILIRHGETDWNAQRRYQGIADIPLNPTGIRQAHALARHMDGEAWDALFSSPLRRALDTARAVARAIAIPEQQILRRKDLMERGYGAAEGLTLEEREARWPEGDWPGLESWESVAHRGMNALDEAATLHAGGRVLMVAHGGLINAVLATISGGEVGTGKTVIENTSRTTILHRGGEWEIGAINDTAHVDALAAD